MLILYVSKYVILCALEETAFLGYVYVCASDFFLSCFVFVCSVSF